MIQPSMATIHLLFSTISIVITVSKASLIPSLLSLTCIPPSQQTITHNNIIQFLLNNLTSQATNSQFTTSTTNLESERQFNGVIQCRVGLTTNTCTLCARNAKHIVISTCPNASAVTAWFDGCYLQYEIRHNNVKNVLHNATNWSCSNQSSTDKERIYFESSLETILLRLRADISKATHIRFSTGNLQYGNGSIVYALVECVQYLSPNECEVCVEKGIGNLYKNCGGKNGGTVIVYGNCIVKYESYPFFSYFDTHLMSGFSGAPSEEFAKNVDKSRESGAMSFKLKVALIWGVGFVCFVLIVFSLWLVKRSITSNEAMVATVSGEDVIDDKERRQ